MWDIPTLQVQLNLVGAQATALAGTLGPSPLEDLMTRHLPVRIPSNWKIVRFDGILAQVPPTWPVHHITITHNGTETTVRGLPPGICSRTLFGGRPGVYVGQSVAPTCPPDLSETLPPTDDGLQLSPTTNHTPLRAQPPSKAAGPQRLITADGTRILVTGLLPNTGSPGDSAGDSVFVDIAAGGRRISGTVGLGKKPAVAEAIVSSITRDTNSDHLGVAHAVKGGPAEPAGPNAVRSRRQGVIKGRFVLLGGPPRPGPFPTPVRSLSGTVFINGHGKRFAVAVGRNGTFFRSVAPGTYRLTGSNPMFAPQICESSNPVRVLPGKTTRALVHCDIP